MLSPLSQFFCFLSDALNSCHPEHHEESAVAFEATGLFANMPLQMTFLRISTIR